MMKTLTVLIVLLKSKLYVICKDVDDVYLVDK